MTIITAFCPISTSAGRTCNIQPYLRFTSKTGKPFLNFRSCMMNRKNPLPMLLSENLPRNSKPLPNDKFNFKPQSVNHRSGSCFRQAGKLKLWKGRDHAVCGSHRTFGAANERASTRRSTNTLAVCQSLTRGAESGPRLTLEVRRGHFT